MGVFQIERQVDGKWFPVAGHTDPISLGSLAHPAGTYLDNPNRPAFTGRAGMKARVTLNGEEIESYVWDRMLSNPNDPESDLIWKWKLVGAKDWGKGYRPSNPLDSHV